MEVAIKKRGRPRENPVINYYDQWKSVAGLPIKPVPSDPVIKTKLNHLRAKKKMLGNLDYLAVMRLPMVERWTRKDQNEWDRLNHLQKEEKHFLRFARKMQKYIGNNQYRSGVFFCKSGKRIDETRVYKYEPLCHKLVRQYFPALALWEASLTYEDLINQCRLEIFLALLNGFDPVKAMTSTIVDPVERLKQEAKKLANPEMALVNAEFAIVYGRIDNYLRRNAYKYHPNQMGGRAVSIDVIIAKVHQEYSSGIFIEPMEDLALSTRAEITREKLLEILEKEGAEKVRELFLDLKVTDADGLLALLRRNTAGWSNVSMEDI